MSVATSVVCPPVFCILNGSGGANVDRDDSGQYHQKWHLHFILILNRKDYDESYNKRVSDIKAKLNWWAK